jgi:alkylhydroperoxidase family enzyme
LKDHAHSPRFNDKEKIALAYAEKITRPPTSAAAAEADALKGAFSEEQIVDIVATVALANLTNRITEGLGLDLEMLPEKI